jgi:aryl-alcohol dehydrogenase-like predicted oxidoreductase
MQDIGPKLNRRVFLGSLGAVAATAGMPASLRAQSGSILTRAIPATGERIPAIGMGTWITFNVGRDQKRRAQRVKVLQTFFDLGGGMIDSSPMYGSSEEVVGHCLERISNKGSLFSATKVWTLLRALGVRQMNASRELWGVERFDLMQIHNMLDWSAHIETLKEWKAQGRIRYIGMTTSHGGRHDALAKAMAEQPLDAVQFTYNILDREAERRLLPLAAERKLAVVINRPFRQGALIDSVKRHKLPEWAGEIDCANWAQFIVSHPAVTCAIPATSRVDHMRENMGALHGRLPDEAMRRRMIRHVEAL